MVLVKHKAKAKVMSLGMGPVEIGNGAIDGDGAKIGEDWGRKYSEYGPYIYEIFTAWINKTMKLEPDLVVKANNPSYPGGWGRRIFHLRTAWAAKWIQVNFDQSSETLSQIISLKTGWGIAGRQGHCLSCTRHWFKPQDREGSRSVHIFSPSIREDLSLRSAWNTEAEPIIKTGNATGGETFYEQSRWESIWVTSLSREMPRIVFLLCLYIPQVKKISVIND